MAIFTILYDNYYPPHGEFKLIRIGKFARQTWVNFTQQYGKNRQRCQRNKFYYAVWRLLLYYYRELPSKIFSVESREQPKSRHSPTHLICDRCCVLVKSFFLRVILTTCPVWQLVPVYPIHKIEKHAFFPVLAPRNSWNPCDEISCAGSSERSCEWK